MGGRGREGERQGDRCERHHEGGIESFGNWLEREGAGRVHCEVLNSCAWKTMVTLTAVRKSREGAVGGKKEKG